ncbi:hypothetical protein MTQ20_09835, partial [Corynebacterium bovis]
EFADPAAAEGLVGPLLDTVTAAVTAAGARPGPVVLVGQSLGGLGAVLGEFADPAAAEGLVGPLLDTVTAAVTAAGARPGPVVLVG